MRFKLTILLVVLNLILAGVIYHTQSRQADQELRRHSRLLFPGGLGDLDEITLRTVGGAGWTLQRRREGWHLARPMEWPANTHAVTRLLTTLEFLEKESVFSLAEAEAAGRTLADYGLEPPAFEVRLRRAAGEEVLMLGRPTPTSQRLYLRVEGRDELAVVGPELSAALAPDLAQWRAEEIFGLPLFDVRAVNLQLTEGLGTLRVRLERTGEDWAFVAPIQVPADRSRVATTLQALLGMRVGAFVSDAPDTVTGLDNPRMRLTLEAASRRQTLLVGEATILPAGSDGVARPGYYARREEVATVFTVTAEAVDALRKAQESLREKAFVKVGPERITGLRLSAGGRSIVLKRLEDGSDWQVIQDGPQGPQPRTADAVLVGRLVEALAHLEAVSFVSDAPSQSDLERFGLVTPGWRIVIEAGETRELQIGEPIPGRNSLYARMAREPFVYEIPATLLGRLRLRPLDYRRRVVEELPAGAVLERIRLTRRIDGAVVFEGAPEAVRSSAPDSARAEAVDAIGATLRSFAVEAFLEEEVTDGVDLGVRVEPWVWELSATVRLEGGSEETRRTLRYWLTDRVGGTTQFGAAPDAGLTFTLPAGLIDALFVWTQDRPPPELPAEVPARDPEAEGRGGRTGTGAGLPEGPPEVPSPAPAPSTGETPAAGETEQTGEAPASAEPAATGEPAPTAAEPLPTGEPPPGGTGPQSGEGTGTEDPARP